MEQNLDTNIVRVSGKIESEPSYSHSLYDEAFYTTTVVVPRLSGVVDTLPVTISEKLMRDCAIVKDSDYIFSGQLRSYNKQLEGVNRLLITVFARNVSKTTDEPVNDIALRGYVCKPTVYRVTPFVREITDILLAVNRAYNKSDYLPCIAWGKNARSASGLAVGSHVAVHGRMQSREYQKQLPDGEQISRMAYEVSLAGIELI